MNAIRTLRSKLTWSHLVVTILSVVIVELLLFSGYLAYQRSHWVAWWAGEWASYQAEELVFWLEGDPLDAELASEFVVGAGEGIIEFAEDYNYYSLLAIVDVNGRLLAANDLNLTAGVDATQFPLFNTALREANTFSYYLHGEDTHIGQAPIFDDQNQLLGWIYYQSGNTQPGLFSSEQAVRGLVGALLGVTLIAILTSLLVGRWLAGTFSRRLENLSAAATELANGRLQERVQLEGDDEIAQLGTQFNQMASQLEKQVHQLRDLADKNALLAEEASSLAALEERNRLARELHDAVKQQVFGLSLLAGSIRPLVEKNPDKATERLQLLERQARDVHVEMDGIIRELRPASLADKGLGDALREWIDDWSARTGIQAKVSVGSAYELPLAVEQALYRVAQEALHNVDKHAQATAVQVRLHYDLDNVLLQVIDNGSGFDADQPQPTQSFGLRCMAERMEGINGRLAVRSNVGKGT
ncbi:MAG: sensor histidine kinase, partial [Chloroflexota bacterium]